MKKKPFEDPLKGLNITYRRGKDLEEWSRFESTFKAYNIKLRQLFIIYDRYCDRSPSFHKNIEYSKRLIEATKKEKILKLSPQESNEVSKTKKDMILCEIDYEAHKGALEASGKTICVMGPGLLKLYPEEHIPLFEEIRKKGLLISENLPSFSGSKFALLQRNRITSGLSDALIAVTGTSGHGVMTQLRHAHEQSIPIFCPNRKFNFSPSNGINEKKQTYKITEIEDINPVLEVIKKNNFSYLTAQQTALF